MLAICKPVANSSQRLEYVSVHGTYIGSVHLVTWNGCGAAAHGSFTTQDEPTVRQAWPGQQLLQLHHAELSLVCVCQYDLHQ